MRVAIETAAFRSPLAGVGYYIHCMIEAMLPQLAEDERLVAFDGLTIRPIDADYVKAVEARNIARTLPTEGGSLLRTSADAAYAALRLLGAVRSAGRLAKRIRVRAAQRRFDVFHAANFAPPGPLRKPVLATIYDLSHRRFPQAHPRERVKWLDRQLPVLRHAPFVQTISNFSKREIVELLGIAEDRVQVAYPGISRHFKAEPSSTDSAQLERHRVTAGEYFMVVATREPR